MIVNRLTPAQIVCEFLAENLTVLAGKLFCKASCECLGLKRSIVLNHVKSTNYGERKKRLLQNHANEKNIAIAMRQHADNTHHKGETLPEEQRTGTYRAWVVKAFFEQESLCFC